MKTLTDQLADYGRLEDELHGPISLEEVTFETVGLQGRTGRSQTRSKNPMALALAVTIAALVVVGGIAFLMGERDSDPIDNPVTTIISLPPPLRQNGEVIKHSSETMLLGDLIAQDPDTGAMRTLVAAETRGENRLGWAAWSADGRWVAYEIMSCGGGPPSDVAGTGGIWVTNGVDQPRQLTKPCSEDGPADIHFEFWEWSPTGAQLLVARQFSDGDALILIDPATGDRTNLGKTEGDVTSLAWSPDGTRIAYGSVPSSDPEEPGSVYMVKLDTGDQSLLAASVGYVPGGEEGSGVRWSPDGERIAIVVATADENRVYLVDAGGSNLELVIEGIAIEHVLGSPNLRWSPDGSRMAYATISGGRRELQIWNASADGSDQVLVFESATNPGGINLAGGPVWSPDGASIAFRYSPTPGQVWMVANADGTGEVREIDELEYLSWRGGWYFCECYG